MKSKLLEKCNYNGMFVQHEKLKKPIDIEILGILVPPDPGMIRIREVESGKEYSVPDFAIEYKIGRINYDKLLTPEQIEQREKFGVLLGNGGYETTLMSITEILEKYIMTPEEIAEDDKRRWG